MLRAAIAGLGVLAMAGLNGCTPLGMLGVGVTAALVPGSTHPLQSYEEFPHRGDAVRQNAAVHIIDPAPAVAQNTQIDMDGERALLAIDRYKTGKVFEPVDLSTTRTTQ